ncbi:hypothetical protein Y032_1045g3484 [Ancylostoma ceylanicum]|uniref:Immunoglobulin I-set domain-containing protein n=1 Tax=Ancylostoma ceylanicum TaxID=53326 RepID=A0A016W7A5_9BILA|nr:hypothetical protein Y032_1045g3484 [Ancylostoma ceylanicum]
MGRQNSNSIATTCFPQKRNSTELLWQLQNYKAKDSGTYTCNIKNEAGEANVELTLNIEGPMDDGGDDGSEA